MNGGRNIGDYPFDWGEPMPYLVVRDIEQYRSKLDDRDLISVLLAGNVHEICDISSGSARYLPSSSGILRQCGTIPNPYCPKDSCKEIGLPRHMTGCNFF